MAEPQGGLTSFSADRQRLLRLLLKEKGVQAPVRRAIPRRVESGSTAPLSFAQQRLWVLDRLEPGSAFYNVPSLSRLRGPLRVPALLAAVREVVRRHEGLRTTFGESGGEPFQLIHADLPPEQGWADLSALPAMLREPEAHRIAQAEVRRPFDLQRGPLVRTLLVRLDPQDHLFVSNLHHIVSDGWSSAVFVSEMAGLYAAFAQGRPSWLSALPQLPIQYPDFAVWQRGWLSGEVLEEQLRFWREQLADAPEVLDLSTDRPRPAVPTYEGGRFSVRFPPALVEGLRALCVAEGATVFMALLAAFGAVVGRHAGQEDVVVGSPIAGRNREELEGLIGFFVNTLALRVDLSGDLSFRGLLARVRQVTHGAFSHQDLPFERLVEELLPERAANRNPLFQVVLAVQNTPEPRAEVSELDMDPLAVDTGTAKFDLSLFLRDYEGYAGAALLAGSVEYSAELFDRTTIQRLIGHLQNLLAAAVADPDRSLSELALLGEAERHQVLREWNAVPEPPAEAPLLHGLVAAQAARTPEAVALIAGEERWTYRELTAAAGALAEKLRELSVRPDERVGVCSRRTPGLLVGLLAVLEAGGAYVPLDPAYPKARLERILASARPKVLLVGLGLEESLPVIDVPTVPLSDDVGGGALSHASAWGRVGEGDNLAYLIYTSGSTGEPKGVAIRHRSAVARIEWARRTFAPEELSRVLASTSIAFDMSVFELFAPLAVGGAVVMAENALALPGLPAASEVTLINTVPSAAAELARSGGIPPSVQTVNLGGEALTLPLVRRLYELPHVRRVLNLYGPSEDTTYSTEARPARGDHNEPTIGRTLPGTRARTLDRHLRTTPIGVPGEVYLGGAGLARGYFGRPALTAERWVPDPLGSDGPGERLYRTGDLARLLPNGELEYLGRIDHQVKIRGFRIELGEIESALESHPAVREAAVLAREDRPGDRRLVAYVVPADSLEPVPALRAYLRDRLPEPFLPAAFVVLPALPRTPNGKVDRHSLPLPEIGVVEPQETAVGPLTPVQEVLAGVWAEVLDLPDAPIGPRDSFFELGGHSLLGMRVQARAREAFGIDLPFRAIFEEPTLEALAGRIEEIRAERRPDQAPPIVRVPRDGPLPLSFAQERMWFLDRMEPGSPLYNVPELVRLGGPLRVDVLQSALDAVVDRHEALRTHYAMVDGEPVQVIEPHRAVPLPVLDLSALPEPVRDAEAESLAEEEARRPFDLSRGPVLRAMLLRLAPEDHIAVLTRHHIVSDGWSMDLFTRDMTVLYASLLAGRPAPLPPLPAQYADFAAWQRAWLQGEVLDRQLGYWRRRLEGLPPLLQLPADRPRPPVQSFEGELRSLRLTREQVEAVKTLARREGVTVFMAYLAVFEVLIHRYTGRDDIVLGTPVANRDRAEVESVIGYLANTLVLRTSLGGDPTFRETLARIRETSLGAYEHQDLPYERLVEELRPRRDLSYAPLFQILFVQQAARQLNLPLDSLGEVPLVMGRVPTRRGMARFDVELYALESPGGELDLVVEYSSALFDAPRMLRLLEHYRVLLEAVLVNPGLKIAELPLLTVPERHQILAEWNESALSLPPGEDLLHRLFEVQADKTPDAVALIAGRERWTYRELNVRADRLAKRLRVGPEDRVGVHVRRKPELVAALLAVLKSGAAYVPLDPNYPQARIARILADARPKVVLAEEELATGLPDLRDSHGNSPSLVILSEAKDLGGGSPRPALTGDHLAYLIYTSGSTGEPKGVAIRHRNAAAMVRWALTVFPSAALARVLASTSIAFDLSVFELFVPLSCGGAVVLAENALDLPALPAASEVTLVNTVPSAMAELLRLNAVPESVRTVNLAGEALPRSLADQVHASRLLNLYGPSEDTTYSTFSRVEPGTVPTIGRPVAGGWAVVLDRGMQPAPVGVPGELFLGGAGLARGYLGRPAATAERWLPDPFASEPGARLYRTGDLARFRADGELEFLGRIDHQVKVRGFRVELGEIEAALASHPEVEEAAVIVQGEGADRRLAAFVVGSSTRELRRFLRDRLPEAMVPSIFAALPALPRTANGKVDRAALAKIDLRASGELEEAHALPRDPLEEVLAGMWSDLLELERVGVHDNFFDLGGHSLLATQLASRIREQLGVELPVRALFEAPTVADQARAVLAAQSLGTAAAPPLLRREGEGDPPLSFAQERIWFLSRLDPESPAYNLPLPLRLGEVRDVPALGRALSEVVRRHEVLRTTYHLTGDAPAQIVHPAAPVPLPVADLSALPAEAQADEATRLLAEDAVRPFHLEKGPVLRAALLRFEGGHGLLLNVHHIAFDGWSSEVFRHELAALYEAFAAGLPSPLQPLPVQYADYAVWQRRWLQGEVLEAQLAYWRERLAGAPAVLDLPSDRPRPAVFRGREGTLQVRLPGGAGRPVPVLATLGRRNRATLFMTVLAAWKALLHRWTGEDDLLIGTPVAHRTRAELEGMIGFFANTLVLRTGLSGKPTFLDLLARVRETALGAYTHQDLPFERLVEELAPERSLAHTPLFQVMFALQGAAAAEVIESAEGGLRLEPISASLERDRGARFDLTLSLAETTSGGVGLEGAFSFNRDLFDRTTAARLMGHFEALLAAAATEPDRPLGDLPLLSDAERLQLLDEWSAEGPAFPYRGGVLDLFAAQVRERPDALAVEAEGKVWSYAELDRLSSWIASRLAGIGFGPEVRIGLCLAPSLERIAAILGVLWAGGAYVPLDPALPAERLGILIEDSGAAYVIADTTSAEKLPPLPVPPLRISDLMVPGDAPVSRTPNPDSLAYLIYTSGSTGQPKGVMVPHRGLPNLALAQIQAFDIQPGDRVWQFAAFGFDASVSEIWTALAAGATVVLATQDERLAGPGLADRLRERRITHVTIPPSVLAAVPPKSHEPRALIVAGEPCPPDLAARWSPGRRFVNAYGPTELTVCATLGRFEEGEGRVSIGRPLPGVRVYVVDAAGRPVPEGVPGELWAGGPGIARGYAGRPGLTAERFVPDPFSSTPGERLYRTGDLVRFLSDGRLEILGRTDAQVKVRGVRIEPGEVEAALRRHPAVQEAAVVAVEDESGDRRLAAYLVIRPSDTLPDPAELRRFLGGFLPETSIPSDFVPMEALPRTPAGKLDRRVLAGGSGSTRLRGSGSRIPPRTPVEGWVAEVWREVLGIRDLGVQDDFFAAGGHSLQAAILMHRLAERLGAPVPVAALLQAPTVAGLAVWLEEHQPEALARFGNGEKENADVTTTTASAALVLLRKGKGADAPLFLVHPVGGNVLCYGELVRRLGGEEPVHGFQSAGLTGMAPHTSLEEMAAHYLGLLKGVQPRGPYRLGGWSMGGVIAFEMARRLTEEGSEVKRLSLFDSLPPGYPESEGEEDDVRLLFGLAHDLAGLTGRSVPLSRADLEGKSADEGLALLLERARQAGAIAPWFGMNMAAQLWRVYQANVRALLTYRPATPFAGRISLWTASENPWRDSLGPRLGWEAFATGGVEVELIPADHYGLLREPAVLELARQLGDQLRDQPRDPAR